MSALIFTRGREGETTLDDVTPAGAQSFALADADQLYAPGQMLFASEADGSETEWLGNVTAADAQGVGFSRPLARSKNSGALVWRAASAIGIPADAALPERRDVQTGVAAERTRGGQWLAVQVAEPRTEMTLTLDALTPAADRGLIAWLAEQAGWGLWPFTLIGIDGALAVVRLAGDAARPVRRERREGGRVRLVLPLWIVQEGAYQ